MFYNAFCDITFKYEIRIEYLSFQEDTTFQPIWTRYARAVN